MTETTEQHWYTNIIRTLFTALDKPAYILLTLAYQLFFNVSKVKLFSEGDLILKFYGRVQLILGVFMMFHLVMIIINGIIDPDTFFSGKKGASSFIMRICVSLILLTTLLPINIPNPQNSYERSIKGNGLLFGVLYSLQDRLLMNNTIGRLIIGMDYSSVYSYDDDDDASDLEQLEKGANAFASTILKTFYTPNLVPKDRRVPTEGKEYDEDENLMCPKETETIEAWKKTDADPLEIIDLVNEWCSSGNSNYDHDVYVLAYTPILPAILGFIFVFIILDFAVQIAVRAIKLAILRLIAPIPIISYMDPKGSGDEALNSWVKTLTSTYIDLFIRLAIVYFAFFLINEIIAGNISVSSTDSDILNTFTFVLICIGLFVFAKEAPKFIKKAAGMKDDGNFSLFGGLKSAIGAGAVLGGSIGAFNASRRASINRRKDELMKEGHSEEDAAYLATHGLRNRAKNIVSGIGGGVGGFATGAKAATGAKDHKGRAALDAISKRNSKVLEFGRSGGTLLGAMGSEVGQMFRGESRAEIDEAKWKEQEDTLKYDESVNAELKTIIDRATSKGLESEKTSGKITKTGGIWDKYNGMEFNAAKFSSDLVGARSGAAYKKYINGGGVVISQSDYQRLSDADKSAYTEEGTYFKSQGNEVNIQDAELLQHEVNDLNATDYTKKSLTGVIDDPIITPAKKRYETATGSPIKTDYNELKTDNGAESTRIQNERSKIARERNSSKHRRDISNSRRFRS